jgi:hypothetical protein
VDDVAVPSQEAVDAEASVDRNPLLEAAALPGAEAEDAGEEERHEVDEQHQPRREEEEDDDPDDQGDERQEHLRQAEPEEEAAAGADVGAGGEETAVPEAGAGAAEGPATGRHRRPP